MTLEEILKKDKTNDVLWAWSPDKGVVEVRGPFGRTEPYYL